MYSYGPPHMDGQKQDDQLEHTYSSYFRIQVVALKTCGRRWMIGRSGERGSGISVQVARHDDYDDDEQDLENNLCLRFLSALPSRQPERQSPQFARFFFFCLISVVLVVELRFGDPFESQNKKKILCTFHFLGQNLGCEYCICSFGQI